MNTYNINPKINSKYKKITDKIGIDRSKKLENLTLEKIPNTDLITVYKVKITSKTLNTICKIKINEYI